MLTLTLKAILYSEERPAGEPAAIQQPDRTETPRTPGATGEIARIADTVASAAGAAAETGEKQLTQEEFTVTSIIRSR